MTEYHHLRKYEKQSAQDIAKLFRYEPETGKIFWKIPGIKRSLFKPAGHRDKKGYCRIMVNGQMLLSSHIAFAIMEGRWPVEIDHKDRNPANDSWNNLKESTRSQNLKNRNSWKWSVK